MIHKQLTIRYPPRALGLTLTELLVVSTVLGILAMLAVPSYKRAVEQSRLNTAAQHLRSVWSAQRLFWLENRTFADTLEELNDLELIAPEIADGTENFYTFDIATANDKVFRATATRHPGSSWIGALEIDDTGQISGSVSGQGVVLNPSEF